MPKGGLSSITVGGSRLSRDADAAVVDEAIDDDVEDIILAALDGAVEEVGEEAEEAGE